MNVFRICSLSEITGLIKTVSKQQKKYEYQIDFSKKEPSLYDYLRSRDLLKQFWEDSGLKRKCLSRTFEECQTEALKYSRRIDFQDFSPKQYKYAQRHGWLPEICTHREACNKDGRSKQDFLDNCQVNNNGNGTLYLLECSGNNESFYKIGITSRSIRRRYTGKERMPYDYTTLKQMELPAIQVWNLEVYLKAELKSFRYQPEIKFGGSITECFRRDGLELDFLFEKLIEEHRQD